MLKFNVDGTARSKLVPAGIGGVLRNDKGNILGMFSKGVVVKDSNKAELLAILKTLRVFSHSFQVV